MALKMFKSLLAYFGGKRKLCPIIFKNISEMIPREEWRNKTFIDGFMGSGAISLFAKAQGFRVLANDIAERSFICGKALIENNGVKVLPKDLHQFFIPNKENKHQIENEFCPDVFTTKHARFLDNALAQAKTYLQKMVLLKYIFFLRPYSKFSSPNAFNRPLQEERFEDIKWTYFNAIRHNLMPPLDILNEVAERVNEGIFSNGHQNVVTRSDVFDFIGGAKGDILYLDPPYAGTLAYEDEYAIIDRIFGGEAMTRSPFSDDEGANFLDTLLSKSAHIPLWVISFGNAGGKNELSSLTSMVEKYRKCIAKEFNYAHCQGMASEEHKAKSKEWVILGHN